ncbi:MAG: thiamine-phosphate kinase [Kiritimatiellae bacterium]|nr:thiamine-phosphate kinase [Kiritimatiellia bacterium]MDD5521090.1 thiamine-phosphate kinase [Kiritimatiellia bacterium]
MKNTQNPSLKNIGELAIIERLCRYLPHRRNIITGAGDDCAVVRTKTDTKHDLLLTSDAVIEGTHFHRQTPYSAVGHKAIARVLSDIAAMGGEPEWALIDLVAPPRLRIKNLEEIYSGATKIACKYGLSIVGGDTASGQTLELHVFAVGVVQRGKAILRSSAKPDDVILVTGTLGGSCRGKHLYFEPRLKEGAFLRKWATSMIDISDGLSSDLLHLTTMSKTGACIEGKNIPISMDARKIKDKVSILGHAMHDGEDFELLFTVPARKVKLFFSAWKRNFSLPCTAIGHMTGKQNLIEYIDKNGTVRKLEKTGYQHFRA